MGVGVGVCGGSVRALARHPPHALACGDSHTVCVHACMYVHGASATCLPATRTVPPPLPGHPNVYRWDYLNFSQFLQQLHRVLAQQQGGRGGSGAGELLEVHLQDRQLAAQLAAVAGRRITAKAKWWGPRV